MLNYPKPDGESWIWSTEDPSHNFRRGCTKQTLTELVTVNQALIFYGKFQEHISGCVQNFKHPSYHYGSVSREINFTGEKNLCPCIRAHNFASERGWRESLGMKDSFFLSHEGKESWAWLLLDCHIPTPCPPLQQGNTLCFSQSGPMLEAKLWVVTIPSKDKN